MQCKDCYYLQQSANILGTEGFRCSMRQMDTMALAPPLVPELSVTCFMAYFSTAWTVSGKSRLFFQEFLKRESRTEEVTLAQDIFDLFNWEEDWEEMTKLRWMIRQAREPNPATPTDYIPGRRHAWVTVE